ncbi:SDR family oxidoreductase [Leifsonia aquatica]|uniref:NAD dependent epimerase/dehydratase family protein n=2 Tax=Leifsonia aquatica TaxID=144185 RepID=U2TFP7_LEIAQ|nr:SDR family oxidoreductase [Leifsonia aquatica]ERK73512.1 NAD dependent epimerase/dehydratase family protein [Leifsonia aquatica ATCC 14665]MBB2967960.1 nucleoside-diphosphate-sugar epimerase [Leifsonia aquatica]
MRVFITGASGGIGQAVTEELVAHGHEVVGLARSQSSEAKVIAAGGTPVRGGLGDLDVLTQAASEADGVIHLAFSNDFTDLERSIAEEGLAMDTIGAALIGSDKPFSIVSGTTFATGRPATEHDPIATTGPVGGRGINARRILDLASQGVRTSTVRLPRSVHERYVAYGFAGILIQAAQRSGVSMYVGDGSQRWPAVHRRDAATLFRLMIEKGEPGTSVNAVGDEGNSMLEIATIMGEQLGMPVQQVPAETFGPLGQIFALDQPASSTWTRETYDWEPTHPSLLADLKAGDYPPLEH